MLTVHLHNISLPACLPPCPSTGKVTLARFQLRNAAKHRLAAVHLYLRGSK